jgi:benzoyl-CoA reductase/2-hydroxyglutaryl-CoA dehydratase subunit BcrC/BadD/HgdB
LQNTELEARLQQLLAANGEEERIARGRELKKQGRQIVGSVCHFMANELLWAGGLQSWRISGTWRAAVPRADVYRPQNACGFCTHVLESMFSGDLDFLAGAVISFKDDDMRRLHGVMEHKKQVPFLRYLHVPHKDIDTSINYFTEELQELRTSIEDHFKVKITDQALGDAIGLYNENRRLFQEIYELRKRDVPPLSGAEYLSITTSAFGLPPDDLNRELKALLPYLKERKAAFVSTRPRLMVSSEHLDHPGYMEMIESTGCVVAMDDMDTGTGSCWGQVDPNLPPLEALSRHYLLDVPNARADFWEKQLDQVIGWARDWRIDGVLEFPQMYCQPRLYGVVYFEARMKEAGIPVVTILRDYALTNMGQLRTRVGAFLEVLKVHA